MDKREQQQKRTRCFFCASFTVNSWWCYRIAQI